MYVRRRRTRFDPPPPGTPAATGAAYGPLVARPRAATRYPIRSRQRGVPPPDAAGNPLRGLVARRRSSPAATAPRWVFRIPPPGAAATPAILHGPLVARRATATVRRNASRRPVLPPPDAAGNPLRPILARPRLGAPSGRRMWHAMPPPPGQPAGAFTLRGVVVRPRGAAAARRRGQACRLLAPPPSGTRTFSPLASRIFDSWIVNPPS